jgi:hypothetical protein
MPHDVAPLLIGAEEVQANLGFLCTKDLPLGSGQGLQYRHHSKPILIVIFKFWEKLSDF